MALRDRSEREEEMERLVNSKVMNEDPDFTIENSKTIYVLSDSTGDTAKMLLSRLLVQFRSMNPTIRMRANVRTAEQLEAVICEVAASGDESLLFGTLVDSALSKVFREMTTEMNVRVIDVMSPLLDQVSDFFEKEVSGIPGGAVPKLDIVDQSLLKRAEAVQFAQQHLLGLNRRDWNTADVLLVGLSRSGKVSIAFYLAQMGIKAASMDFRPYAALPAELSDVDPRKVCVVEMQANVLARRRQNRERELQSKSMTMLFDADYTDLGRVHSETEQLNVLVKANPGWQGPVDVTHLSTEDSASMIMRTLRQAMT